MDKLLRLKQVMQIVPASKSSIYGWIKVGRFPKPVKFSERCSAWREEDIRKFLEGVGSQLH